MITHSAKERAVGWGLEVTGKGEGGQNLKRGGGIGSIGGSL